MTSSPGDVAVVGGGAIGTTAAYDLARRGVDVTLFEQGEIAAGSTGRAAGVLYDAFAEDVDAAIGRRAFERFRSFSGEGPFELRETPYVWLAREGDELRGKAIERQVSRMRSHGVRVDPLEPADLEDLAPALRTDDVGVAAVAHDAGRADPAAYARLLARKAEREGATVRTETRVSLADGGRGVVDATGDREVFDAVVVAAGAHTKRLLADAGYRIAMKPYRVQALSTRSGPETPPPMLYDATAGFYLRPHGGGLLIGDGTEEVESDPDGWERDADPGFIERAVGLAGERLAVGDPGVAESWAGLCTATPDRNPLMGWLDGGPYVATGWQGHGVMRAPALGERIAEELCGENGIEAFDPTRFTGEEEFAIVEGMAVD
jgi:glycine/D-amino acid oxidase-like deaminating enzyme